MIYEPNYPLVERQFKVFEYPIKHPNGKDVYYGSYTIGANVKPLGYKGEKLVQTFSALVKA